MQVRNLTSPLIKSHGLKTVDIHNTPITAAEMNGGIPSSGLTPPASDTGVLGSETISGFGYGIGVSVGILLLITTITLASYFCTRNNQPQQPSDNPTTAGATNNRTFRTADIEIGLDEETLRSYPKLMYSQMVKKVRGNEVELGTAASCCSICLADYKESDILRVLPDCKHLFHLSCVDPWLRLHPTCPVCRTSPLPSPLPTPLAEVVPLARRP